MAYLTMPIRNDLPAYTEQVELEGVLYFFTFLYNERLERWTMDIADENENPLLSGIPILVKQNLIERFKNISLPPGRFLAINEADPDVQPDRLNFSGDVKLLYRESTTV